MTITTYYVTRKAQAGFADMEAQALIHCINDTTFCNGDNRSWNATRAHLNALMDAETQTRLGVVIEAEECEAGDD